MVLTWNAEPSTHQSYYNPPSPTGLGVGNRFSTSPRFRRDSTNRIDKQPNFLNGHDEQGYELPGQHKEEVDTNTHTRCRSPLQHAQRHNTDLALQMEKSLFSVPTFKSTAAKDVTPKSLTGNDTRILNNKDPYIEPLGPGHYWIEGGKPALGPYPANMPSRSSSPMRNPDCMSSPFVSRQRPDPFPPHITPDNCLGYYKTESSLAGTSSWPDQANKRVDVTDYRSSGRYQESRKEVPNNAQYPAAEVMNVSGKYTQLADTAVAKNTIRIGGQSAFFKTEPRLVTLPNMRHNDLRLSHKSEDEGAKWLGPGAYTPLTSTGSAKRKSYRLFNTDQRLNSTYSSSSSGSLGARSATESPRRRMPPHRKHSLKHVLQPEPGISSSFATTTRAHAIGPRIGIARP